MPAWYAAQPMDLLAELTGVFRTVFDDDGLEISRSTTARDVDGWDSVMHVTLIIKVEQAFGVRFTSAEVAALSTVGDLVDQVKRKLAAR